MSNEFWITAGFAAFLIVGGILGLLSKPCELAVGTSQEGLDKVWFSLWVVFGIILVISLLVKAARHPFI